MATAHQESMTQMRKTFPFVLSTFLAGALFAGPLSSIATARSPGAGRGSREPGQRLLQGVEHERGLGNGEMTDPCGQLLHGRIQICCR